jgi:hypothetical protein
VGRKVPRIHGQVKYFDEAYRRAAGVVLVQCDNVPKKWELRDHVANSKKKNQRTEDLYDKVIKLLDEWLLQNQEIV